MSLKQHNTTHSYFSLISDLVFGNANIGKWNVPHHVGLGFTNQNSHPVAIVRA